MAEYMLPFTGAEINEKLGKVDLKADRATTLLGYGIIDGATKEEVAGITIKIGDNVEVIEDVAENTGAIKKTTAYTLQLKNKDDADMASITICDTDTTYDEPIAQLLRDSEDIDMLIGSHLLDGTEKTLTVGKDIQVGQTLKVYYLVTDGYSYWMERLDDIGFNTYSKPGVSGSANKWAYELLTIEDYDTYTFTGVYGDIPADLSKYATNEDLDKLSEELVDLKETIASGGGGATTEYEEVDSVEEMTDTSKCYVLKSTGTLWGYRTETIKETVPAFTNLIKFDEEGNPTNVTLNQRLNSSGATSVQDGSFVINDYLPVNGVDIDKIYIIIKPTGQSKITHYADTSGNMGGGGNVTIATSSWIQESDYYVAPVYTKALQTGTYFKFSSIISSAALTNASLKDLIVTHDEPIVYTEKEETVSEWHDTGMAPSGVENAGGNYIELLLKVNENANDIDDLDSRVTTLESLDSGGAETVIPTWWEDEVADTVSKIKALQVGANTITFPFFSDNHQRNGYAGVLIKKIMDECNIPYCLYGGDSISSAGNMTEEIMIEQDRKFDSMMKIIPNGRFCRAVGNHDGYWLDSSSVKHWYNRSQIYDLFLREESIAQSKHFGMDGTYYYIDEITSKTRFIILNTEGSNGGGAVDAVQLDWLKNVALKFDDDGYSVVFISHRPISNHYHAQISNAEEVIAVVNDCINGNDKNKADIVGWFSGHIHRDRIYTGMAVNTTDDSVGTSLPFTQVTVISDHVNIGYGGVSHPIDDSDQSHAIDFVTINKDTREVNITRLGFGEDRSFTYEKSPLPNTLIPPITVDFSEESWVEMGGYTQEATFMFEQGKAYRVMWEGVEYICDEIFDLSDVDGEIYAIGNKAIIDIEDYETPFLMVTASLDGEQIVQVINIAYDMALSPSTIATFSVETYVEEDLPVYKCHFENTTIDGSTAKALKGISFEELKRKDRAIELNKKLYTSNYKDFGPTQGGEVVFLTRVYSPDLLSLSRETVILSGYYDEYVLYVDTYTSKITLTNTTTDSDV